MLGCTGKIVYTETYTSNEENYQPFSSYFQNFRYKYISVLDYDDIILPLNHTDWFTMMKKILPGSNRATSYYFKNFYFLDDMVKTKGFEPKVPKYMHMLQNVYRSTFTTGQVKSIHSTADLVALGCHTAQRCFKHRGMCKGYMIPKNVARWQHYRSGCGRKFEKLCRVSTQSNNIN